MDVAVVTGAASGPALASVKRLIGLGLRVYGIDADFTHCQFEHADFVKISADLYRQDMLARAWKEIIQQDEHISIIVHAARAHVPAPLESAHPDDIHRALEARLVGPALLTRFALPYLIRVRGTVVFISESDQTALPSLVQGGIQALVEGLFAETRDTGLRVTELAMQPNSTTAERESAYTRVDPEEVAEALELLLRMPPHNIVTRWVIRPQATRSEPFEGKPPLLRRGPERVDIQLPPKENFPEEPELIMTPPRERPADAPPPGEDDDAFEEEDDELDRLLAASRKKLENQVERRQQQQRHPEGQPSEGNQEDGKKRRRRRRRRGGRDRSQREGDGGQHAAESPRADEDSSHRPTRDNQPREDRDPAPRADKGTTPAPQPSAPQAAEEAPSSKTPSADTSRPAKKVAAKKAARKATKKVARKAAKKAVKKAAKKAVKKAAPPKVDTND